jgi:hypothetical protein
MSTVSIQPPKRRLVPLERINRQAQEHGVATARVQLEAKIDRTRLFTPMSLAPLSHSWIFGELTEPQRMRYNQLVALMQNEIICFFEQEFAVRVLPAMMRDQRLAPELKRSMQQFVDDERQHTQLFRSLNQRAEPEWYAHGDTHILRIPRLFRGMLRVVTSLPAVFPMVFWIMLLMEERSLMISRRYAEMDPDTVEPNFAAAYAAHLEDEVRHVQVDWHLLKQCYLSRPRWLRRINARLLEWFVAGLCLKPRRANVRLVELLTAEFPELSAKRLLLVRAVRDLLHSDGYREMMYSADSTPIAVSLLKTCPELRRLHRIIYRNEGEIE